MDCIYIALSQTNGHQSALHFASHSPIHTHNIAYNLYGQYVRDSVVIWSLLQNKPQMDDQDPNK